MMKIKYKFLTWMIGSTFGVRPQGLILFIFLCLWSLLIFPFVWPKHFINWVWHSKRPSIGYYDGLPMVTGFMLMVFSGVAGIMLFRFFGMDLTAVMKGIGVFYKLLIFIGLSFPGFLLLALLIIFSLLVAFVLGGAFEYFIMDTDRWRRFVDWMDKFGGRINYNDDDEAK